MIYDSTYFYKLVSFHHFFLRLDIKLQLGLELKKIRSDERCLLKRIFSFWAMWASLKTSCLWLPISKSRWNRKFSRQNLNIQDILIDSIVEILFGNYLGIITDLSFECKNFCKKNGGFFKCRSFNFINWYLFFWFIFK